MGWALLTSHPLERSAVSRGCAGLLKAWGPYLSSGPLWRGVTLGTKNSQPCPNCVPEGLCRFNKSQQSFAVVWNQPIVSWATHLHGTGANKLPHQTFPGGAWPIAVGTTSALISVEIIDSAVYLHYDRQKLKCIKHSNPSSCRWEAGASRVQTEWLPLLTMAEVLTVQHSFLLTRLFSQLRKSNKRTNSSLQKKDLNSVHFQIDIILRMPITSLKRHQFSSKKREKGKKLLCEGTVNSNK